MVNLFEQWNDMDFASTYEPIDWKALNDFANRARQDAKDNADMLKEKMKEFDTIYKDPNSEKVAAKVAKNDELKHRSIMEAIPEFMRFNIVESEVRNVT